MTNKIWTKAAIIVLLRTNDRAIGRALVALTERQTSDEQRHRTVKYKNGKGFRPCHGKRGVEMAQFFERAGFLTPKQLAWWRRSTLNQGPRIEIYADQLTEIANNS